MIRIFSLTALFIIYACNDKGEPIFYTLKNTSKLNLRIELFHRTGISEIVPLSINESRVLDKDLPPYDLAPFFAMDSIKILFEDNKKLIYKPFRTAEECYNLVKNPFCSNENYIRLNGNFTFKIDSLEYDKAK